MVESSLVFCIVTEAISSSTSNDHRFLSQLLIILKKSRWRLSMAVLVTSSIVSLIAPFPFVVVISSSVMTLSSGSSWLPAEISISTLLSIWMLEGTFWSFRWLKSDLIDVFRELGDGKLILGRLCTSFVGRLWWSSVLCWRVRCFSHWRNFQYWRRYLTL